MDAPNAITKVRKFFGMSQVLMGDFWGRSEVFSRKSEECQLCGQEAECQAVMGGGAMDGDGLAMVACGVSFVLCPVVEGIVGG